MTHVEFDMSTRVAPDEVNSMLLDFSPQRPEVWPGLWAEAYEVYSVADTSAEVREGNRRPRIWAHERYDWSTPGVVRWQVVESNFCAPGSFVEARLAPRSDGGTDLHITWDRTPTTAMSRIIAQLIKMTKGAPVKGSLAAAFKKRSS